MTVRWRRGAAAEYREALLYLDNIDPAVADRMRTAVIAATNRLARRPMIGRPSRYSGYRVWSLPKWSKLIVYRERAEGIEVAAFLDVRRDPPKAIR